MVHEIALAWPDVGVGECLVHGERVCLYPFAIFVVKTFLCDLTDVDLRVEVCGKGLVVVAGVAVHDVEVGDLVEDMLDSVGGEHLAHARIEATAENGGEARLLEAVAVSPLPTVLKVCLVLRLVVGGVEIVDAASQTGVHDRQILVGQGEVDDQLGLVAADELLELLHIVSVDLSGLDVHLVSFVVDGLDEFVALVLVVAGDHQLREDVLVLYHLEGADRSHASGSNH